MWNIEKALQAIKDEVAEKHIRQLENQWRQAGISGVPSMIFNRSSLLTGAQPVDVYKRVLTELNEKIES